MDRKEIIINGPLNILELTKNLDSQESVYVLLTTLNNIKVFIIEKDSQI